MQYVAAYAMVVKNSTETLSNATIKSKIVELFSSIQAPICEESLDLFLSNVEGKSFNELISAGSELMKSQISSSPAAGTAPKAAEKTAKVVEKEESSSEEAALDFF